MDSGKRNAVLGLIAVVALAAAVYRFTSAGPAHAVVPSEFTSDAVCLNCQQQAAVTHANDQRPPYACPACGEQAAFLWWYCQECHRRFVPSLMKEDGVWRPQFQPRCTACDCASVTAFNSKDQFQSPVGDAEHPPWPPK